MIAIAESHFGKFPDPDDFQCWRVNFKTEVCVSASTPELNMSWINEVEMAGFLDDLVTSQSIEVQRDFADFEMLDARISFALRRIISDAMKVPKNFKQCSQRTTKNWIEVKWHRPIKNWGKSEATYWSDDKDTQFQSPKWETWELRECWSKVAKKCQRCKGEMDSSKGDSWSFNQRSHAGQGAHSFSSSKAATQTEGRKPCIFRSSRGASPSGLKGREGPFQNFLKGKCTESPRDLWHPPVCLNY